MEKTIEIPEGYEARIEGNKVILEPKESEDEKIRKAIFHALSKHDARDVLLTNGIQVSDALAWIEKQCKQNPAWSEEDEEMLNDIIQSLIATKHFIFKHDAQGKAQIQGRIDWLKSLKDKVLTQSKPAWTGEDERHKNTIIRAIHGAGNITPIEGELAEEWLKSKIIK